MAQPRSTQSLICSLFGSSKTSLLFVIITININIMISGSSIIMLVFIIISSSISNISSSSSSSSSRRRRACCSRSRRRPSARRRGRRAPSAPWRPAPAHGMFCSSSRHLLLIWGFDYNVTNYMFIWIRKKRKL